MQVADVLEWTSSVGLLTDTLLHDACNGMAVKLQASGV